MNKEKAELIKEAITKECRSYSLIGWCDSWGITTDEFETFLQIAVDHAENAKIHK